MVKRKSTGCGDWHLGWGFGGHDKLGTLHINEDDTFTWTGKSQGRHGRTWNHGATCTFKLNDGKIEKISQKGNVPIHSELISSAQLLSNETANK